ncbi:hypothetical protein L7F22_035573 [Adiantum nelumboides]|nr:hypothetical protein [Adiantum nelumboides]
MEIPGHLSETMQSPKPMPDAQEQVAETPIFQAIPVQPATFQQPNVGSNGQGSNLQAMQQVFPPPSVHPGYFGGGLVFQSMAGHAPGNQFYTPGTVFGGAQAMMHNPMYSGIGMQPGFQSTQGPIWDATGKFWCQPWTIVLTGFIAVLISWFALHSIIATALVTAAISAWWYIFLYSYPQAYAEMIAARRQRISDGDEDTYGSKRTVN